MFAAISCIKSEHPPENFCNTACTSYITLPMFTSNYFLIPFEFDISGFHHAFTNTAGCSRDANLIHKALRTKLSAHKMTRTPYMTNNKCPTNMGTITSKISE